MDCVLIVDDSLSARWIFSKILKANGYEVIEADNGDECVEKIEIFKPDCVLLDLLMPDKDGFDVLDILNKRKSKTPVIILSADIQETTRKRCYELGAVNFLNKPPKEEELLDAVETVVSSKGGNG